MYVNSVSNLSRAVAEQFRDNFDIKAFLEKPCCKRVPQGMDADFTDSDSSAHILKRFFQSPWQNCSTVLIMDNETIRLITRSRLQIFKSRQRCFVQRYHSLALFGFRLLLYNQFVLFPLAASVFYPDEILRDATCLLPAG